MKFSVVSLIFTLGTASAGKTILQPPEIIVYYLNENMAAETCTANELKFVDNTITPALDMILHKKNFVEADWSLTVDDQDESNRMLRGQDERNLSSSCDWCRRYYPKYLCNAMYNCRFRRHLQTGSVLSDEMKAELKVSLAQSCKDSLMAVSSHRMLSSNCMQGLAGAECYVEFN